MVKDHIEVCDGDLRRFDVELFIKHPSLSPEEITAALGLEPHFFHAVGAQRKTPKGALLEGTYWDTRWRYCTRHEVRDQWFGTQVQEFVDRLVPHKNFLTKVKATGGEPSVIIQFLGDGYFGDGISSDVLAKIAELNLDLQIECFMVPQS